MALLMVAASAGCGGAEEGAGGSPSPLAAGGVDPQGPLPVSVQFDAEPIDDGVWACAAYLETKCGRGVVMLGATGVRALLHDGQAWKAVDSPAPGNADRTACATGDFDRDGNTDLAIVGSQLVVMKGDGQGRFSESSRLDLEKDAFSLSAIVLDADADGLPDIYAGRYNANKGDFGDCVEDVDRVYCHRAQSANAPNAFFHNLGGGRFERITVGAEDPQQTQGVGAADLDGDGKPELVSSNDPGVTRIYAQSGPLSFSDVSAAYGVDIPTNGMGVAAADFDADGRVDLALSVVGPPLVFLQNERGRFTRAGQSRGIKLAGFWMWGSAARDFDGDGDVDLLMEGELVPAAAWPLACTHCREFGERMASLVSAELVLYRNDGQGSFAAEIPAKLPSNWPTPEPGTIDVAGGVELVDGDFDADGKVDAIILRHPLDRRSGRSPWFLRGK